VSTGDQRAWERSRGRWHRGWPSRGSASWSRGAAGGTPTPPGASAGMPGDADGPPSRRHTNTLTRRKGWPVSGSRSTVGPTFSSEGTVGNAGSGAVIWTSNSRSTTSRPC
jgi:hypothetical protein